MAASSPLYAQSWNYDVYLCFRGRDTHENFAGHLYEALQQRGVVTYNKYETPLHGEPIRLFKAIQDSRIAVIVFSENFAESSWCLDEVIYIMKCHDERGQTVLPVFYDVERSDVRRLEGGYAKYLEANEQHNDDKVYSCREAFTKAIDIAGWEIRHTTRNESQGITQIADAIAKRLYPNKDFIGTRDRLQGSREWFDNQTSLSYDPSYYTPATYSQTGKYQVFLSFGEDARTTFVGHLYSALDQRGILTYMDKEMLPLGQRIYSSLKGISESRIVVIIFSKYHASSSHCLDELEQIMKYADKKGQLVMPIFYHVNPSDVRHQRGTYGNTFDKHNQHNVHRQRWSLRRSVYKPEQYSDTKIESWRKALQHASNLFGWRIFGNEAKCIKQIVDTIYKRLHPEKGLIGTRTHLEDFIYGGRDMATLASSHVEHLKIPYNDILIATNNFAEYNIIAKGGFGMVYKGSSKDLGNVAIKKMDRRYGQGDYQFMMEIALLSAYKHENLVSLVGFCTRGYDEKILIYKYESNGSLDKHLPSKDLTWIQRLQICLDAASGLKYLHDDVGPRQSIIHRDIKSSNILLDENRKAKISDFGLSKIALVNVCTNMISRPCGTRGYVDPQYEQHGLLSQSSDVYSFGVVLFEVLCGRLVNTGEHPFTSELARSHYEKKTLDKIIDSDLRNQMNSDSLSTFSTIAYRCLKKHREERPTMSLVVEQLEKALDHQTGSNGYWQDVYICYRDRDTGGHIVDDLCAALHQVGLTTNKDDMTHSRKESILLKAIERSRASVIIFTKKFAVNSWYLDELAKIIECMKGKGQLVLPIFYNVHRCDVQMQKGYFGEVVSEYDTHPRMEVWRNALIEASTTEAGLEYSNFRFVGDLIKKTVEEIKSGLSKNAN